MIISFYSLQIYQNHYFLNFCITMYHSGHGNDAEKLKVWGLLVLGFLGTLGQHRNRAVSYYLL
jgi:hypothetical protein